MTYLHHAKIQYSNTLHGIAIMRLLWVGCVYVDHLYHFGVTRQHRYPPYICLKYGVNHSHVVMENGPQGDVFYDNPKYHCLKKLVFGYLARSPPLQLIQ
ncbi:hypothetical protein QWZ16_17490 [Vibrio ostreicida]|uniref:Uncharacterized protein n=1 Tax=Vibrio ostreicida TaxID=526588 RepID=A0ABT8BXL4_9VIBR|nr:hypothetical protein [Vibrio ostreicida]MDN3611398.1 hypothetical protein [Vibrio ostreicida]